MSQNVVKEYIPEIVLTQFEFLTEKAWIGDPYIDKICNKVKNISKNTLLSVFKEV